MIFVLTKKTDNVTKKKSGGKYPTYLGKEFFNCT